MLPHHIGYVYALCGNVKLSISSISLKASRNEVVVCLFRKSLSLSYLLIFFSGRDAMFKVSSGVIARLKGCTNCVAFLSKRIEYSADMPNLEFYRLPPVVTVTWCLYVGFSRFWVFTPQMEIR